MTTLIALVAAAVLNGESLVHTAETQPYGTQRDVALAAARPVRWLGSHLGLHLPRHLIEDVTGRELREGGTFGGGLADPAGPVPGGEPTATTAPPRTYRTPTAEEPLGVLFVGDSLVGNVSAGFGQVYSEEPRMRIDIEYRVATGLARPDVLDWSTHLAELLEERPDTEVVVMMFGGNDAQDMTVRGRRRVVLSDGWVAEYERRVAVMLGVAGAGGRTVVWLGLPAVDDEQLERARRLMNEAARSEADKRPGVRYVDLSDVLTPGGAYRATIGNTRVRDADGVHITVAGAALAAPHVFNAFADRHHLAAPPSAAPQPTRPRSSIEPPRQDAE